ncbi:MAG TPA: tetratricopeptide repeat protein [Gemmataceae bacterium]|nr:tetratricopeptide repeat protein [Gemmataceae bacterium]
MNANESIQLAARHHQAGRATEAERICRQVLGDQPEHLKALHLLGIVSAQGGRVAEAAELLRRVVRLRPDFADGWANLGCVLVHHGKADEAIAAYIRVAELSPTNAAPHYAMGLLLREQGRPDEAIEAFSRAVELKPDYAEAHFKLGIVLRSKGRLDEAIAAYSKAIDLKPDHADAHNNLANALRDKRQFDEAIAEYEEAIRINPEDAVAQLNLGNVLSHSERFAEAVGPYERAIRIRPDYFEAFNQLGLALANLQQYDRALQAHRRALALGPDDARGHETLGATLLLKHDMSAAAESFRRAIALGPAPATTWNGLGMALQALGEFDEATDCFRRALEINPDKAFFHKNLITTSRQEADPAEVERLNALLNNNGLPVNERVDAGFALGKLLDDSDRFDEAFESYARANALFRQSRAASGQRYESDNSRRSVDRIIQSFTPEFFARRRTWGDPSERPTFIVGMPRSGTTLVEQIAASHPAVFGAGELQDIDRVYSTLAGPDYDRATGEHWQAPAVAATAKAYLEHLRSLSGDATRVTDKMPGNVWYLGLIAVLFPNARVIFCRRDARDNCLSCYFQQFGKKNAHFYGYDLADCGRQFLETERLIAHWLKVLPLRMLEIRYEEMVADQEGQSRRLIDLLGLPWDPACLEFHRTKRAVVTASVWQVRQPIYTRSVGRWRHYQRHLGPLLEVLDGAASTAGVGSGTAVE